MLSIGLSCLVLLAPMFAPSTELTRMATADTENKANDAACESLLLTVRYFQEGANDAESKEKVLAEGSMAIESGHQFWHFSGGVLPAGVNEHEHPFGTNFGGKVVRTSDNRFRLSLNTSVGSSVFHPLAPDATVIRSNRVYVELRLILGETKRVSCGGEEWIEVRIEKMPETHNAAP